LFYLAASHTPQSGFDHQDRAVSDAGVDSQSAAGDSGAEGSDSEFVLLFTVDDLSSFETESLPHYDDPEATGSVTWVPEQQDGQEKDQGDGVPIPLQANKEDATQLKSLPVSTPQALGSEKEQQNQEEQGQSLSNNSHEYLTSGYSQHFLFPHPNFRRN